MVYLRRTPLVPRRDLGLTATTTRTPRLLWATEIRQRFSLHGVTLALGSGSSPGSGSEQTHSGRESPVGTSTKILTTAKRLRGINLGNAKQHASMAPKSRRRAETRTKPVMNIAPIHAATRETTRSVEASQHGRKVNVDGRWRPTSPTAIIPVRRIFNEGERSIGSPGRGDRMSQPR